MKRKIKMNRKIKIIVGSLDTFFLILLLLKLTKVITWSWWVVTLPITIPIAVMIVIILFLLFLVLFKS